MLFTQTPEIYIKVLSALQLQQFLPAWKSMPTANDVPETGTRASDLSEGSNGIPRMPSCTEYNRKEPTPADK